MFVKYSIASGEIVGVFSYVEHENGFGFVEVDSGFIPTRWQHYVLNGKVVELPSENFVFNKEIGAWVDPRTLADLKAAKWEQVKAQRDAAEFGLFTWAGHAFDGDEAAQRRINLAVMGAQAALIAGDAAWSVDWTLADNTSLTISASDMMGVANALGANIAQAHAAARAKRQQIQQAATKEELDAI